jgi:O-antigen/teichoic acid export membrane protein
MYAQFIQAIKWNTGGIILYKIILFVHQTILYKVMPSKEYGIVGALFSTIYFLIPFSNCGFDYTILSFFEKKRSVEISKFVFVNYFYRVCTILGIISVLILILQLNPSLPANLIAPALILFFFESIKQSLKTHAHILHVNKEIALVENLSLIGYVTAVWGYFLWTGTITLLALVVPFAITSSIETLSIVRFLLTAYKKLPEEKSTMMRIDQRLFFKESLFNYINQLAKALYSPNFFIILVTFSLGFESAGYIKYVTTIIVFLYNIFYRSMHLSGGALLAGISKMSPTLIKKAFNKITAYYFQLLVIILIYFSAGLYLYAKQSETFKNSHTISMYAIVLLISLMSFIEYGTLTYETLFISQKQGRFLAHINFINIAVAFILSLSLLAQPIYFSQFNGLNLNAIALILLCLIKMSTTTYIIFKAYKIWNVSIHVTLDPNVFFIHLLIALTIISYFL